MAFGSVTSSDFLTLDANFEAFEVSGVAIAVQLAFGESVTFRFNVDAVGTTDDIEIEVLTGHRISTGNGLDAAASATSLDLDTAADAFTADDDMNSTYLVMTSGGESGEMRLITDSTAAADTVVLDHALSGTPSAAETYDLYRMNSVLNTIDMSAAVSETAPHNKGITRSWTSGEFVMVRARATGATDAHRIQMSYHEDGGPA